MLRVHQNRSCHVFAHLDRTGHTFKTADNFCRIPLQSRTTARVQPKRRRAEESARREARGMQEGLLARLLPPDSMEQLGVHLHCLLQPHPNIWECWLAAQSLGNIISKPCFGAALLLPQCMRPMWKCKRST